MSILSKKQTLPQSFSKQFGQRFYKLHPAIQLAKTNRQYYLLAKSFKTAQNKPSFEYYVFYSMELFWNYFLSLDVYSNQFYAIYYTNKRSLYLDIDCYDIDKHINFFVIESQIKTAFSKIFKLDRKWIKNIQNIRHWESNFFIYSACRRDKISLHILNPKIVCQDMDTYTSLCKWLQKNSIGTIFSFIDILNRSTQLYRLPFCIKQKHGTSFTFFSSSECLFLRVDATILFRHPKHSLNKKYSENTYKKIISIATHNDS